MNPPRTPFVAQRKPHLLELPPGEYLWCACGHSKTPPLCDGCHDSDGSLPPLAFTVTPRSGLLWLCGCKHTRTPPFCDGAHNRLPK